MFSRITSVKITIGDQSKNSYKKYRIEQKIDLLDLPVSPSDWSYPLSALYVVQVKGATRSQNQCVKNSTTTRHTSFNPVIGCIDKLARYNDHEILELLNLNETSKTHVT